jgi:hypothetical protein
MITPVACQLTGIGGFAPLQSHIVTHPIATFCIRSRFFLLSTAPGPYSTITNTPTAPLCAWRTLSPREADGMRPSDLQQVVGEVMMTSSGGCEKVLRTQMDTFVRLECGRSMAEPNEFWPQEHV